MIPTKNFSSRLGERVRLLAIHSTEGARSVQSLGLYFQQVDNASYHGAVDDRQYESYVNYSNAAWHLLNANQEADGLALCGFARWTRQEWLSHPKMLDLAAAWLAERSKSRNIPLVHLNATDIRNCMANRNHPGGVIMHRDYTLATRDGTHTDLGNEFPLDDIVLPKARAILNYSNEDYVNPELEAMIRLLPAIHKESTTKIPSRSGDPKTTYVGTVFDFACNSDGYGWRIEKLLREHIEQTPIIMRAMVKEEINKALELYKLQHAKNENEGPE